MIEFYETLAEVYEDVFPLAAAQVEFVRRQLPPPPRRVIDLGCGTGALARELAQAGYVALGVDLSQEMIAQAKSAVARQCLRQPVSFQAADMRQTVAAASEMGGLLCLGNTLAHLTDQAELSLFLRHCCQALAADGRLVGQIVNYDRIARYSLQQLPTQHGRQGNQLERSYRQRDDGLLDFVTRLTTPAGARLQNAVALRPLCRRQLDDRLRAAGFGQAVFYGSYRGEDWSEETFHTIFVAGK